MKSRFSRWTKMVGLGAVAATLLSAGLTSAANIPVTSCPNFFTAVRLSAGNPTPGICISNSPQTSQTFQNATFLCHIQGARVASYEDLVFLYNVSSLEPAYSPISKWLGPGLVVDDKALCGNKDITFNGDPDINNFEGTCNKNDQRQFWCAMDLR
jgi:hypothetical protein